MKFDIGIEYTRKANDIIPGGAHTYSKGFDQFPEQAPGFIAKGKGAIVWDGDGNEFIDWGMGLRSVSIGHADARVLNAVKSQLELGVNFTRPNIIELEVANEIIDLIPCAEMVKFSKNGSDVTTAAIKLARAFTGKDVILRCKDHPFFSVDDWFIGNTNVNNGIPECVKELTDGFHYNDIESLHRKLEAHKGNVACIIMEPAATKEPDNKFLHKVRDICNREGIVLIFDEIITGFRWHPKGAQHYYGVTPDLATFGKAIANGFSFAALAGKKNIMELGGLRHKEEKVFLLSSTYGGETHSMAAALATINILKDGTQIEKNWEIGNILKLKFNNLIESFGIQNRIKMRGPCISPYIECIKDNGDVDLELRTLLLQESIQAGILAPYVSISASHNENILDRTFNNLEISIHSVAKSIKNKSILDDIKGQVVKPVFREFN
jgi:glutamate-1-semialdehyde 2,1-aminomutase